MYSTEQLEYEQKNTQVKPIFVVLKIEIFPSITVQLLQTIIE